MTNPQTLRIRELNDTLRRTGLGGNILITRGIKSLSDIAMLSAIEHVRTFDAFTPDNDPHGEHDFGSFSIEGRKVFWKIDYYAPDMLHGSEDPADPTQTRRVLTIMLAEEY